VNITSSILVTGCAGFIGSHLTEFLLSEGHSVVGIDNFDAFYARNIKEQNLKNLLAHPGFKFYENDITDVDFWQNFAEKIDVVVHLAAKAGVRPSLENPLGYISTNLNGTQLLLNWMVKAGVKKLAFASSSSVYGNNEKVPFAETDSVDNPISPYAFTKKAGELLNHTYHHLYGIDVINLRFFTVYGERQRPDLAIHKFTKLMLAQQPISMYGTGNTARDYTYVADTVQGIVGAVAYLQQHEGVFETVNLGNSSPATLQQLVDTLYALTEQTPNINYLPMQPGDVERTYAEVAKAKTLLGYNPKTPLHEGLKRFVQWYKSNHDS
jgi:UDP-glucuronate 4-epimerase